MYVRFKKFRIAKSSTKKLIYDSALMKEIHPQLHQHTTFILLLLRLSIIQLSFS